jgi:tetratricopeptide (TPR) repeat protein
MIMRKGYYRFPSNYIALTAFVLLVGFPLTVAACLWDRDTLAAEGRGMPDGIAVLTGRFERNPDLYYEMRLTRIESLLKSQSLELALYDDAGVACDRLGRHDEAIAWMIRKKAILDASGSEPSDIREHLYRYHANYGTFLVHRWLSQGADRSKIHEVELACEEIAKALEINPDAHFGRETYQLQAMQWIVNPPKIDPYSPLPSFIKWPSGMIYSEMPDPDEVEKTVNGLAGLVTLGNAWSSVDVFYALSSALQLHTKGIEPTRLGGRNSLAYLAWLRCNELIDQGGHSLLLDSPRGELLKQKLYRPDFLQPEMSLDRTFQDLREEADQWHSERTAFMLERMKSGSHPDTDPHFWDGYTERVAPVLPPVSVVAVFESWQSLKMKIFLVVIIGVPLLVFGGIGWLMLRRRV